MSLIIVPKNNKQKIPRDKVEEFVKLNWKVSKIAKELGCSSAGIRGILRQNNIKYNIVDFEKEFNEAIRANGANRRFVAVLGVPPVVDAVSAVRVAIAAG